MQIFKIHTVLQVQVYKILRVNIPRKFQHTPGKFPSPTYWFSGCSFGCVPNVGQLSKKTFDPLGSLAKNSRDSRFSTLRNS